MSTKCTICGDFKDKEYATQKYGSAYPDTYLPENYKHLVIIKDLRPNSERLKQILQCPQCGTYYLYETDYEYFAFGSEDEQTLSRLTESEAMALLNENNG